jgi:phosphoenolpyruvate-protein kinase (PTS system EI component)
MVKRASARGRTTTADLVLTRTLSTPDGQFAESLEALMAKRRLDIDSIRERLIKTLAFINNTIIE